MKFSQCPQVARNFKNNQGPLEKKVRKVDNTAFSILLRYFKWAGIIFEISRDQPPSRELQRWAKPVFSYFDDVKGGTLKNLILVISFFYFLAVTKKIKRKYCECKTDYFFGCSRSFFKLLTRNEKFSNSFQIFEGFSAFFTSTHLTRKLQFGLSQCSFAKTQIFRESWQH